MDDKEELFELLMEKIQDSQEEKYEKGKEDYGNAWIDEDPDYLYRRVEEEFYEWRQAVEHDQDLEEATNEVGDFLNFAVMYMVVKEDREKQS